MTALLHTKDLAVGHRGRVLLRELGLVLNAGELVALLGVNGIGKSTLLHTLTGALPALQGEVLLKGETLSRLHPRERAKRVSIVLTERATPALLDVRTVVALGRQPWTDARGRLTSEDERVVDQAVQGAAAEAERLVHRVMREIAVVGHARAHFHRPASLVRQPKHVLEAVDGDRPADAERRAQASCSAPHPRTPRQRRYGSLQQRKPMFCRIAFSPARGARSMSQLNPRPGER